MPRSPRNADRQRFFRTEIAGGLVLLGAAVVALVWANSPWDASYRSLWAREVRLAVGTVGFDGDLRHFVNEALMAVFFLVVGLEIKRELVVGEMRAWRTAALPAVAALGGMVVPALLYTAIVAGGPGERGWGIPMATDIAFALGAVALLGSRVPPSLKLFLLTLAIVDDLGAIAVIAVFYSGGIRLVPLGVALAIVGIVIALRAVRVTWMPVFVAAGVAVWLATYESGVSATIAGAAMGLLAPIAVAERVENALHPLTSFGIVPLFALANAGVSLDGESLNAPGARTVALAVGVGLVLGKILGITAASWVAVRSGLATLPRGTTWAQLVGIAALAGIGFTVSLLVASLAFGGTPHEDAAKIGILAASVVAVMIGVLVLYRASGPGTRKH